MNTDPKPWLLPYWPYRVSSRQCCGHWFWLARSGSRKATNKIEKRWKNFMFWSSGCSLLKAKGFSCSLTVLYRGLGKNNCNFLLLKGCFTVVKFYTCWTSGSPLFRILIETYADQQHCFQVPGAHSVKKIRVQRFRSGYRHPPAEVDLTNFLLTCWSGLAELAPNLLLSRLKDWRIFLLTCWSGLEELPPHLLKSTGGTFSSPAEVDWRISLLTCWSGLEELSLSSPAEVDCRISLLTCWSGL